jgi:hypothetical protein
VTTPSYSIDDLRTKLAVFDAKVAKAERDLVAAQQRLAEARERRAGAQAFITVLESEMGHPHRPASSSGTPGPTLVVESILRDHPAGLDMASIQEIAVREGVTGEQVRSAVTYLRRRGDAENMSRGVWRIAERATNEDGPAEARPLTLAPAPLSPEAGTG